MNNKTKIFVTILYKDILNNFMKKVGTNSYN